MKQVGNRVYYDELSGRVILTTGERQGDVLDKVDESIKYIDLAYGDETLKNAALYHVENGKLVVDELYLSPTETPEQRIAELENQLLIAEGVI